MSFYNKFSKLFKRANEVNTLYLLVVIVLIHLFLLLKIVFWVNSEFLIFPYLTSAGLVPYKDIIDQHFPGVFFFPINLYSLGLTNPIGFRLIQLFIVASNHIAIYFVVKEISKNRYLPFIANVSYLIVQPMYEGYVLWIDTILSIPLVISFFMLIKDKKLRSTSLFLAGFFLGLGVLIKQTTALFLIAVILILLWKKIKLGKVFYFLIGGFIPIFLLVLYINRIGVWKEFFYWTLIFNKDIYANLAFRNPTVPELIKISVAAFPPFILGLWILIRKKLVKNLLLFVYLVLSLFFVYGRYDFAHLQPFLPFASIAIALGFGYLIRDSKKQVMILKLKMKKGSFYTAVIFGYLLTLLVFATNHIWGAQKTFVKANQERKMYSKKLIMQIPQKSNVYVYNGFPEYYLFTKKLPPSGFFTYKMPWYRSILEDKILKNIKNTEPEYIIRRYNKKSHIDKTNTYIQNNYETKNVIKNLEILRKIKI